MEASFRLTALPARRLHLKTLLHLRREQILRLEPAVADALLEGVLQEGVERRAVRLDAVGHQLLAGDVLRPPRQLVAPRDRQRRGGGAEHAVKAAALGLL